jgi:16S rRNA (guanine966-N2)-methyltransferase
MRIISGRFKGRRLKEKIPDGIRPTMDSTRETIFNILQKLISLEDLLVCDVFAGTGAFGFETLSRGCRKCVFIDNNRQSIALISTFAKDINLLKNEFEIEFSDALKYFKLISSNPSRQKFSLIFMDPPYKTGKINEILNIIAFNDLLLDNGIIVVEIASSEGIIVPSYLSEIDSRVLGQTKVIFLKKFNEL